MWAERTTRDRIQPEPIEPARPSLRKLQPLVFACCQWLLRLGRRPARRLRLCESLPLGERRFVAVVEFEQSRFLVGGTTAALVLLARLENIPCEADTAAVREASEIPGEKQL